MPWFKVDDGFHGHPKVVELSLEAVGAWTLAGSWCASYLTDGEIGLRSLQRLGGSKEQAQELIQAGLWLESEPNLYQFKDWEDYQPLKETVEAEREAARDRMQKVRAKKKGTTPEGSEDVQANVQPNNTGTFGGSSEEVRVTPSRPIPSHPDPLFVDSDQGKKTPRRSPEREIPEGWKPNAGHQEKAEAKHLDVNFLAETFRNHAATHDRRARDWDAAFRNWIIKATPGTPPAVRNVSAQYSWANQ